MSEQKEFLYLQGIRTLLYPDDDMYNYGSDDEFIESNITHWRTRIRFENIESICEESAHVGKERIIAFTHEKFFDEQKDKIEYAIKLYKQHGYMFI